MDGALVGHRRQAKTEPMTGTKSPQGHGAGDACPSSLLCGMVAVAFVLLISIYLIISGLPAILEIGPHQLPVRDPLVRLHRRLTAFSPSSSPPFAGTAGAILVGVPVGLMTAIFLSKVAPPKLAAVIRAAVELLAGIPSVVYGLVGMIVLVPAIRETFDLRLRRHACWRPSSCWR